MGLAVLGFPESAREKIVVVVVVWVSGRGKGWCVCLGSGPNTDSTLPQLRARPYAFRLVNECQVGTPIRQSLKETAIKIPLDDFHQGTIEAGLEHGTF